MEKSKSKNPQILAETSMRHVHLSQADLETLFGKGAALSIKRPLSQPGQFLANQRVNLVGEKSTFENVGIIGPLRKETQIEISRTDSFALGVKNAPIRQSGDLAGAPELKITAGSASIVGRVIIAKRHVHLTPETAAQFKIRDGQILKIKTEGERAAILGEVVARISPSFADAVHLDADEANAILPEASVELILND